MFHRYNNDRIRNNNKKQVQKQATRTKEKHSNVTQHLFLKIYIAMFIKQYKPHTQHLLF